MSRERRLLEVWALVVLGLAVHAFAGGLATTAPELWIRSHRVDPNRAGVAELQVLPGLGAARAEAIVLERIRRGRFDGIDDLARVPGLGAGTLGDLMPWISFEGSEPQGR